VTREWVPPHNIEAEESVLGGMLLDRAAAGEVLALLSPDDFYRPAHRTVFAAVAAVHAAGGPLDTVTVSEHLRRAGVLADIGGAPFLFTLISGVPTVANAGLVRETSILRQLIDAGTRIRQLGFETGQDTSRAVTVAAEFVDRVRQAAGPSGQDEGLFSLWTPAELLAADRTFRWRVRGMLVHPSFGPIGGERKSLKSYLATFVNVGLAADVPILGHFKVDEPAPVVAYVGEGGRIPYTRRLERIAAAMDVQLDGLPLFSSFDVAPVGSERFGESLARDLRDHQPGLVSIDPLYAFHPPATKAQNLYARGPMLASVSASCVNAGACLLVPDHFNKSGSGRGLDRITQAGVQEWADTWLLLSHREPPDVEGGEFHLTLEIGSRQWGGSTWDLDLSIGRFDADLGEYDGAITWDLARATGGPGRDAAAEDAVLTLLGDQPYELTESAVAAVLGGNRDRTREALRRLLDQGRIVAAKLPRREGERVVKRRLLGVSGQPVPEGVVQVGTGSPSRPQTPSLEGI